MLQNEVFPYYRKYSSELNEVYSILKSSYEDDSIDSLCKIRGYVSDYQRDLLTELGVGTCMLGNFDVFSEYSSELGLMTKNDNFLLNGRYIIPVYAINGDLVSLIGYYPDVRKYITLPTPFFSKDVMFFNFKQAYEAAWGSYSGVCILVEGVFDCLSLRSIGLPCIATMGSTVSETKGELLKLFSKIIAIPDDDTVGRRALNRYDKKGWKVPYNATFVKFHGGLFDVGEESIHCKDMDDFVSWYEPDDVRDCLMDFKNSKKEIEELVL